MKYEFCFQESFFGMRPVEGRCLLDVVVDEPNLVEHQKPTLVIDRQKEACELNEMDSEVDMSRYIANIFLTDFSQSFQHIVAMF